MSIVNVKIIFAKKQKQTCDQTPNSRQGEEKLIMTEMFVFTLQTDVR